MAPNSAFVNKMETLSCKTGSTAGVALAACILRRYVLASGWEVLLALALLEGGAYALVAMVTGFVGLRLSGIQFNLGWLRELTWNVVAAVALGSALGSFWRRWARASEDGTRPAS